MQAFDNIDGQTIERFYNNYLASNGDKKYRYVILGVWTVDVKDRLKMLTEEPENTSMHRIVLRGTVHERQRPTNSRFGGGSLIAPLKLRDITAENNDDNNY